MLSQLPIENTVFSIHNSAKSITLTAIKRVKYTQVSLQLITVRLFIWRYAIRKKRAVAYATRQGPKYALLIYKNAASKYLMLYIIVVSEAA